MRKRQLTFNIWWPESRGVVNFLRRYLVPHPGTLVVTLLVVAGLLWAAKAGALPLRIPSAAGTSTGTIAYQGRLADSAGNPITDTVNMIFRLYDVSTGGVPLWEEQWTGSNGVRVSDGLFNVMLGSLTPIPLDLITGHDTLWLGITVGTDDEMQPRVQLGSVPFAMQALTVPDGSITTAKIADGAVTQAKLGADVSLEPPDGSITTAKLADGAVTSAKLNVDNGLPVSGDLTVVNGNVGIGTTGPTSQLEIFSSEAGASTLLTLHKDVADIDNTLYAYLDFTFTDTNANGTPQARIGAQANTDTSRGTGQEAEGTGDLLFFTASAVDGTSNNLAERMRITATGNVGIGTSNPGAKLDVNGDFRATGTKSAVVQAGEFGQRKLYAAESPEVRFFDEGLARLKNGVAHVRLDPIFLETIEDEYLVHVTPYGDASLYVAEIGKDYFIVKAREGDPNVTFAWRLSAVRKGYAGVRLEEAD